MSLTRVDDGEIATMSEDESLFLRQLLESEHGRSMFEAFVRSRRETADVQIIDQNLES